MSMMGFQKSLDGRWVGGVSSIQVYFGFLEFFNFAKPLRGCLIRLQTHDKRAVLVLFSTTTHPPKTGVWHENNVVSLPIFFF